MSEQGWSVPLNDRNPDPRVACVVLADVSLSMKGEPIEALERGFEAFVSYLQNDSLASKRVEVAVITFGSVASVLLPMQEARGLRPVPFTAAGTTNMADGINYALDLLEDRKRTYRAAGIQYYRPWILLLTDGKPNLDRFEAAVARLNAAEAARGVTVFAVGTGPRVDYQQLTRLSNKRRPKPLNGLKFAELFEWLSASLSNVTSLSTPADDDTSLGAMDASVPLPSTNGWTSA